ncbi:MAG: energy transducer TonB [Bacteroidota bacterium]
MEKQHLDPTSVSHSERMHRRWKREGRRPARDTWIDLRLTRYLLSLAVALGLVAVLFVLPIGARDLMFGWGAAGPVADLTLLPDPKVETEQHSGGIQTRLVGDGAGAGARPQTPNQEATPEPVDENDPPEVIPILDDEPAEARPVLEFVEHQPSIEGGLGALYMNIEYPEDARVNDIEGRVIVRFVVEPDGSTSDIQVSRSLYASCDSAAVRAVRNTRFVPGRQNGHLVRVRMNLPVRFRLIDANEATAEADEPAANSIETPPNQ